MARRQVAADSTAEMLRYAKIRSDDPLNPGPISWAPWEAQVERLQSWDSGTSEVVLKARQLGFSWLAAGLALRKAMYGGMVVGIFSVGQREAREELKRIQYIHESLPDYMKDEAQFRADDVDFPQSGGKIMCFPSTEQAGISFTFGLVFMDEAGFHPYAAANYAALRPALSAGGQIIINSTANPALGRYGFFHDIYWQSKNHETPYQAVFVPWDSRPGRDALWLANERAAFTGMPEHFDAYYPSNDLEAFIGKSGLVYPQFTTETHVKDAPFPIEDCVRLVGGVDFGGGDPTAVVVMGMDKDQRIHQFAEFYRRGTVGLDEIAQFLGNFKCERIMCDPSEPVAIETLRGMGFPAMKANNRRNEGLGFVAFLLENNRLSIDTSCKNTINEFSGYRWRETTDPHSKQRYATSTPVDNHADALDAGRYAIMELTAMLRKRPRVSSLSGKPLRKHAV